MSNEPGNEDLKNAIDKEFESITKRYLSHDDENQSGKRMRQEGEFTQEDDDKHVGIKRTRSKANIDHESNKSAVS